MIAVPDRNLAQQQRHARGRLQQLERLAHALVGLVDLVEEQEARDVQVFELAQDQLQLRHLLLVGLADHDRGIDRRQRRAHVVDEFDGAGAIDEGVAVAHEIGGGDRKPRRSSCDGALPCWRRRPWCPRRPCPDAGSRRCGRGSLRAALSCRSGTGPPARCTVDPNISYRWDPNRFVPCHLPRRPGVRTFPALVTISSQEQAEAGKGQAAHKLQTAAGEAAVGTSLRRIFELSAAAKSSDATPAALKPVCPVTDRGCSATDAIGAADQHIGAEPDREVASAVAPAIVAGKRAGTR